MGSTELSGARRRFDRAALSDRLVPWPALVFAASTLLLAGMLTVAVIQVGPTGDLAWVRLRELCEDTATVIAPVYGAALVIIGVLSGFFMSLAIGTEFGATEYRLPADTRGALRVIVNVLTIALALVCAALVPMAIGAPIQIPLVLLTLTVSWAVACTGGFTRARATTSADERVKRLQTELEARSRRVEKKLGPDWPSFVRSSIRARWMLLWLVPPGAFLLGWTVVLLGMEPASMTSGRVIAVLLLCPLLLLYPTIGFSATVDNATIGAGTRTTISAMLFVTCLVGCITVGAAIAQSGAIWMWFGTSLASVAVAQVLFVTLPRVPFTRVLRATASAQTLEKRREDLALACMDAAAERRRISRATPAMKRLLRWLRALIIGPREA